MIRRLAGHVWNGFLRLVWRLGSEGAVVVRATPGLCLRTLMIGARPSTERLHLRDVFTSGRRYMVEQKPGGFRLTTTSVLPRYYRRRTRSRAVLVGRFIEVDGEITRVQLSGHVRLVALAESFLIPAGIASIIVFVPWHPVVIGGLLATLWGLSWVNQRTSAALEVHEMLYFVHKALGDLTPAEIMPLSRGSIDITPTTQDFEAEWERFYESRL